MKILVLNCGSSSVKYQLLDMESDRQLAKGSVERIGMDSAQLTHTKAGEPLVRKVSPILDHTTAIKRVLSILSHPEHGVLRDISDITAVGHRVVHGGESFSSSVLITPEVRDTLRCLIDLAPLHNPANLMGINAAQAALPGVPQVAVFDTAFHSSMPRTAFLYALPYVLYKRYKVRRYGFHGSSHRYVSERAAELMGKPAEDLKIITCHLGNGASVAAVNGGHSVDTSMGFTPLEGLVMGTRSGDIDPAALLYIMGKEELGMGEAANMLNKHSGLQGLCGMSDMREIEQEMGEGNPKAQEAFDIFTYRVRKYIGSYAAAMEGVDAIVFTGGIGENSTLVREAVCSRLGFLGLDFDTGANANASRGQEAEISRPGSRIRAFAIPTNEELVIARDTAALVRRTQAAPVAD
ncbi:MAG: acetate kinase [Firmicutes bacterium]|nr:acetate kinase [Bacillota bacterium]